MRKGNLLIIDDEVDIIEIIKDILSKFSVNIYTAKSGKEALEKIKSALYFFSAVQVMFWVFYCLDSPYAGILKNG